MPEAWGVTREPERGRVQERGHGRGCPPPPCWRGWRVRAVHQSTGSGTPLPELRPQSRVTPTQLVGSGLEPLAQPAHTYVLAQTRKGCAEQGGLACWGSRCFQRSGSPQGRKVHFSAAPREVQAKKPPTMLSFTPSNSLALAAVNHPGGTQEIRCARKVRGLRPRTQLRGGVIAVLAPAVLLPLLRVSFVGFLDSEVREPLELN